MDITTPHYARLMAYIDRNPAGVLSTINDDGSPHGSVVYVCTAREGAVYFVTKNRTQKYLNITKRPTVGLTFFNEKRSSTLQASGRAFIVNDPQLIDYTLKKITKVHAMQADWLPPLAKIRAGNYAVIGVKLTDARLAEFQGRDIGNKDIFTQIGESAPL